MKRKILSIGLVGIVAALLTAVVVPTSAQAANGSDTVREQSPSAVLLAAPTTTPSAASRVFQTNRDYSCPVGDACAVVPYANGWYIFKFYNYGTYYLSNWSGTDQAFNNQTGGAAMRLQNNSGGQLQCLHGIINLVGGYNPSVNWGPVYRIQLTSSLC
ncbi:hypothetical protein GCM10023322_31460 [Rugosimonospora acidiphila]|uniref:Peptidase inhibitor family I36 n=1 Tax=Rugosimonospora acidiphila TaxID=556531 RepID=A0ABP9RSR2_9ACTN